MFQFLRYNKNGIPTYLHDKTKYQQRKPLRKNQDFLYISGSHAVDLASWVIGEQIISVQANSENELSYHIKVTFSSGTLGSIILDATSSRAISGTDLEVFGEKGALISHIKKDLLLFYKKGDKNPQSIKLPNKKTYTVAKEVSIIDNYLSNKIKSPFPLPVVDETVNVIKTLDFVKKSIASNGKIFFLD